MQKLANAGLRFGSPGGCRCTVPGLQGAQWVGGDVCIQYHSFERDILVMGAYCRLESSCWGTLRDGPLVVLVLYVEREYHNVN